jgi:hypothetical protein
MAEEENVAPVLRGRVFVGPKVKVASEVHGVMVRDKAVRGSALVALGVMNVALFLNAAKHRNLCLRSTQPSFPTRRAWSRWHVR